MNPSRRLGARIEAEERARQLVARLRLQEDLRRELWERLLAAAVVLLALLGVAVVELPTGVAVASFGLVFALRSAFSFASFARNGTKRLVNLVEWRRTPGPPGSPGPRCLEWHAIRA